MRVFLQTNPFRRDLPQYHPALVETLPEATDFTPALIGTALRMLQAIYRTGYSGSQQYVPFRPFLPHESWTSGTPERKNRRRARFVGPGGLHTAKKITGL